MYHMYGISWRFRYSHVESCQWMALYTGVVSRSGPSIEWQLARINAPPQTVAQ